MPTDSKPTKSTEKKFSRLKDPRRRKKEARLIRLKAKRLKQTGCEAPLTVQRRHSKRFEAGKVKVKTPQPWA